MKQNKPDLGWIEDLTRVMDSKYRFPGTNFRFGLDPILGLIPFVGDMASFGISAGLLFAMWRHGASGSVKARMTINILLDFIIGSIPIVGGIFDFFFKGNQRNLRLLKRHYEEGRYQGSGKMEIAAAVFLVLGFLALVIWGLVELLDWIF